MGYNRGIENALGEIGTRETSERSADMQIGRHGVDIVTTRDGHFRPETIATTDQGRAFPAHAGNRFYIVFHSRLYPPFLLLLPSCHNCGKEKAVTLDGVPF